MKSQIIFVLMSLVTLTSQAQLKDCQNLTGAFACSYEGSEFDMTLSIKNETTFSMTIMSESRDYTIDGREHQAPGGASDLVTGTCSKENGIVIVSKYKNAAQQISYVATPAGVNYVISKPNQEPMTIICARK